MTHYVYVVECSDDTLYTGYTTDVGRRIAEHNAGTGAKYTAGRRPVTLRYVEYHDWKEQNGNAPDDSGAWLATAIKREYDLPPKLQETIDRAKEETAQWCESMFEGLSENQQEAIEAQAFDNMSDKQKQKYREGNAAAQHERLRQRNRILLSRREDLL